jgi:hypothetical protein
MYEAVQQCKHCGAKLTLDDLRKPNCTYCGTVYPHHAQAAQHAQVVGQVMGQMMHQQAQIQDQWRGAFGAPPMGGPVLPMVPPGAPGSPYADPMRMADAHMKHAAKTTRTMMVVVFLIVGLTGLLVVAGAVAAVVLAR